MATLVTVSGDGLEALQAKLEYIASGAWKGPLYQRIGERLHELVQQEWDNEADPFGTAWAPTTRPNPILNDTGALRGSTSFEVTADGITLTIADFKAAYHQYGTSRGLVPRPMLPEDALPPSWAAAIEAEVHAFFAEQFGK